MYYRCPKALYIRLRDALGWNGWIRNVGGVGIVGGDCFEIVVVLPLFQRFLSVFIVQIGAQRRYQYMEIQVVQ